MDLYFSLSGLFNAVASIILGLFVFFKNKSNRINQTFALFCLSVAVWSFFYMFWPLAKDKESTLLWFQLLHIGANFAPITYLHFVATWLGIAKKKKVIIISGYLLAAFFASFVFSSHFIKDLVPKFSMRFWAEPGALYHFYLLFFFGYAIYSSYLLVKYYNRVIGTKKTQMKYIFIGMVLAFAGGSTNYPLWYNINFPPFGNILASSYVILSAYAILKYRLMDIRLAVKRSTIFSLVVITITAIYAMSAFLVSLVIFGGVYTLQTQIITGLIVALLVAIGFRPLYEWLKKTTDAFLFKGEYLPQELMADITDVVSGTLDLDIVIDTLKDKITKALRVKKIEIIILKENSSPITSKKRESLKRITDHFKKQRDVLVLEEMKRKHIEKVDSEKSLYLIKDLEKLNTALAIPLLVKKKLVGIFLLNNKKSGDMFTNEDIKTLETIAAQAGIAIENARLYEEMKDFSKTLQKEVDRQTKTLKDANVRLKQLDVAKSEFISLASHQLRTPLSIIKGYVSMIMEGSWGQVTNDQKEQLNKVYLSNDRLIKLVEDLLTVSRIESGRLDFDLEMVSLENMVDSVVKEFAQIAKNKKLYLKFIKPEKQLPKIRIDSLKIRQVVQNLIDNALHYTKEGGIKIKLKLKKDKILFSIQDTGIGISDDEKVVLFEKFSRGKDVGKMHTEGTGLGLYLSVKMIGAHQGKIWVESEGKGKGSTFYFELPVKWRK